MLYIENASFINMRIPISVTLKRSVEFDKNNIGTSLKNMSIRVTAKAL